MIIISHAALYPMSSVVELTNSTSALGLACVHLGIFYWLDEKEVSETIQQAYVSTLSLFLVNAFRTFLAASLGMSFTQILWKSLRERPMRLRDIDSFMSVLANPLYLCNLQLVVASPVPFLCAVVAWCIPIAAIFPPGALVVGSKTLSFLTNTTVPSFDPGVAGNGTWAGLVDDNLWQMDSLNAFKYDGASHTHTTHTHTQKT